MSWDRFFVEFEKFIITLAIIFGIVWWNTHSFFATWFLSFAILRILDKLNDARK